MPRVPFIFSTSCIIESNMASFSDLLVGTKVGPFSPGKRDSLGGAASLGPLSQASSSSAREVGIVIMCSTVVIMLKMKLKTKPI